MSTDNLPCRTLQLSVGKLQLPALITFLTHDAADDRIQTFQFMIIIGVVICKDVCVREIRPLYNIVSSLWVCRCIQI